MVDSCLPPNLYFLSRIQGMIDLAQMAEEGGRDMVMLLHPGAHDLVSIVYLQDSMQSRKPKLRDAP